MKVESRRNNMRPIHVVPIRYGKVHFPTTTPYCVEWFGGVEHSGLQGDKWFTTSTEALAFLKWLRISPVEWIYAVSSK